jgi:hypothetical protein
VERINSYAVMRNTATFEAYRAYNRAAMKAAGPFFLMGTIFLPLWISLQVLVEPRFVHARMAGLPLFVAWMIGPAVLCLLFTAIGLLRVRQHRREHPIPEEWRQVPRTNWPLGAGRKHSLP